ncbi:aminotransferase class I/II-fold pyridoxal phosphate-dependent enzyme [Halobacillus litoralis]|uniref:Aminotransferase class I/II-fold pyridoxal phosphate-dependent enzyme n=1 Tax=Halobacillus litoralis TaxID=45668 RepID=A0A845F8A1_9BACI|nr:aminotransferase class I/II-fold pyridoxal phosphate-dependent enzyme [Halobacillus litoralis]MYL69905.1 aminotransferase class I/II-fold pyridoxal phosphate-dependent enzyme [Halobacillus litoralis]
MSHSKIYLSPPHMTGNEQKYINEAFDSNWIAPVGRNIDLFEQDIAHYVGAKGAVAVSSGTAAIHLALSLLGVKKGDTVFCSSLTFVASANPILYQSADPVFIDSEPESWNMSPQALNRALVEAKKKGKLPKAIIVVHLYGQPAKMEEIMELSEAYDVPVVEDAAESLGSTYQNQMTGSFGKFGVFSFNGNKIITTSGGGALVSDDLEALDRARFLATQARDPAIYYQHSQLGFNYRLSNILAGIGRAQMEVIEDRVQSRKEVFESYKRALSEYVDFQCNYQSERNLCRENRWLTAFTCVDSVEPLEIIEHLREQNIEARPIWKPLHLQPLFEKCMYYTHSISENVSEEIFRSGLCLPSGSNLSKEDQGKIIDILLKNLRKESLIEEIV